MKRLTIYLIFSLFFLQNLKSQDSLKPKQVQPTQPVYSIKLYTLGSPDVKGKLMDIRDSSIYIFQKQSSKADPLHSVNINDTSAWEKYDYRHIAKIKMMDKTLRALTTLGGIALGVVTAAIIIRGRNEKNIGIVGVSGDDVAIVLAGVIGGAIVGTIVASSIEKKYRIDGDWKKFEVMKAALHY